MCLQIRYHFSGWIYPFVKQRLPCKKGNVLSKNYFKGYMNFALDNVLHYAVGGLRG
jgi:hypothetical protein